MELWALWILNQKLNVTLSGYEKLYTRSDYNVESASFGFRGVPEAVLDRLAEFGVVEARNGLQQLRTIVGRSVKEQIDASAHSGTRDPETERRRTRGTDRGHGGRPRDESQAGPFQ